MLVLAYARPNPYVAPPSPALARASAVTAYLSLGLLSLMFVQPHFLLSWYFDANCSYWAGFRLIAPPIAGLIFSLMTFHRCRHRVTSMHTQFLAWIGLCMSALSIAWTCGVMLKTFAIVHV
jgi:hypothetical protein